MRQLVGTKRMSRRHEEVDLEARFEVDRVKRVSSLDGFNYRALVDVKLGDKRFVKALNSMGVQINHDINILSRACHAM
jgi:hypothetical protein